MGNHSEYNNPNSWKVEKEFPYYQLMVSNKGRYVERYFVSSSEYSRLYLRVSPPTTWVQVLSCNSQDNIHYIIVQRIKRLSEAEPISLWEGFRLLKEIITGYKSLSKIYGRFELNLKMIGVNDKNEVRMWIHENFGASQPMTPANFTDQTAIRHIIHILSKIIRGKTQSLEEIFSKISEFSFENAASVIQDLQNSARNRNKLSLNKATSRKSLLTGRDKKCQVEPTPQTKIHIHQPQSQKSPMFERKRLIPQITHFSPPNSLKVYSTKTQLSSPRMAFKRVSIENVLPNQKVSLNLQTVSNPSLKKRGSSSEYSTYMTLNTQREVVEDTPSTDSFKRIRSESSFVNNVQLFQKANFNGSFGRKLKTKTFPLDLPIVISLDQVPSKEVIIVEESTIVRGGSKHS